jgi:hypothetical protein
MTGSRHGKLLVAGLAGMAASCSSGSARTTVVATRDSAGVVIVELTRLDAQDHERWTVSNAPIIEIGAVQGDPRYELHRIQSVSQLESGEIAVLNGGTAEIRMYDSAGRHVRSFGGRGRGPGEFAWPLWMLVAPGDTLVVYDANLRKFSLFTATGDFARDVAVGELSIGYRYAAGVLNGGAILMTNTGTPPSKVDGVSRDTILLRRISTTGIELPPLGRHPGEESFWRVENRRGEGAGMPLGFGRSFAVATSDSFIYIGTTDAFEIRSFTHDGALRRILRADVAPVPVTPDLIESHKQRSLAGWPDSASQARFQRVLDAMPYPATMPAFSRVAVDDREHLWVREYPQHEDSADWHVFDRHGHLRASVRLPAGFRESIIHRDRIIGTWSDANGVERVQVFALRRRG